MTNFKTLFAATALIAGFAAVAAPASARDVHSDLQPTAHSADNPSRPDLLPNGRKRGAQAARAGDVVFYASTARAPRNDIESRYPASTQLNV
ncbi:MAG: hypothetical protein FJX29_06295 [Alphaproteobacteria bacterium]|nr:hypothetical protein [Alphaproteobacteria bacterium]